MSSRRGHSLRALGLQWGSWAALAVGATLTVVGWYGVSGERFVERQIPYLASCTIPGAALIVAGAVLLSRGDQGLAAARVDELYALLLTTDGDPDDTAPPAPGDKAQRAEEDAQEAEGAYLAVPGGTLFHRSGCPLVSGRSRTEPADEAARAARSLAPCPVCEPASAPEA